MRNCCFVSLYVPELGGGVALPRFRQLDQNTNMRRWLRSALLGWQQNGPHSPHDTHQVKRTLDCGGTAPDAAHHASLVRFRVRSERKPLHVQRLAS